MQPTSQPKPETEAARWDDDAFLDRLRDATDPVADEVVARLIADGGIAATREVFSLLTRDADPIPEAAPLELHRFFAETARLPAGTDPARLDRGEELYTRHAFVAALVLLCKSLPSGYSAPCLASVLSVSGDLRQHPYKRLMGVLQMLVNVTTQHGFEAQGAAVVTAQKMRLLHAGVRAVVPRYRPRHAERFGGPPVNHEDMLATIMGFSLLVIEGMQQLGVPLRADEAEDLYYPWRVFAQLCGLHPPGEPDSTERVPVTLAEATRFYDAYCRRHFATAAENPAGVRLARENLEMVRDLVPRILRLLGFGMLPRVYMQELLGTEGMRRVGLRPLLGHRLLMKLAPLLVQLWQRGVDDLPGHTADRVAQLVFHHMIVREWNGEVTFLVPDSRADLRHLA